MAKRSKTPSYIVNIPFQLSDGQEHRLQKWMDACEKIQNTCVKQARRQWYRLQRNHTFMALREKYWLAEDKNERKALVDEMFHYIVAYGLSENNLQAYINVERKKAFGSSIGADVVQKIATRVYQSVNKAIFKGKEIHYLKKGHIYSFEGKSAKANIIYQPEEHAVQIFKKTFPLQPLDEKDRYLMDSLCSDIKYCRVIREHGKHRDIFYLQLVMKGKPPAKVKLGDQECGADPGPSAVAFYTKTEAGYIVLAEGVEKYERMLAELQRRQDRKRRINNPEHYDANGQYVKGCKNPWVESKAMKQLKRQILNVYRLKRLFVKQCHGVLTNKIVSLAKVVYIEEMDWSSLAKRSSKPTEKSNKTVQTKTGNTVQKNKRKKRFGRSINKRSPGAFERILRQKMQRYGGAVQEVNTKEYCATQYDPTTQTKTKMPLNQRTVTINGKKIQRDMKSAYLLCHPNKTLTAPDFDACVADMDNFFKRHDEVVECIKQHGDPTRNFGLKDFLKDK